MRKQQSHLVDSVARQSPEAKPATLRSQMVLAFHKWRTCMTKLKLLSAALIATAMIATPAMARKNHVTSRHLVEDANASITSGTSYSGRASLPPSFVSGHLPHSPGRTAPLANLR